MNDVIRSFTDLKVWQHGHQLVLLVYKTTGQFPKTETYALVDQMRRAAASITANIAEGFGRQSYREKIQFYYLAQGSLTELKNFILVARDIGYISGEIVTELQDKSDATHRLLQGLISKSKMFPQNKSS